MQDIDAPETAQAGLPAPTVHVPCPTAKEACDAVQQAQHQTSEAPDQRQEVMQGTNEAVRVLVCPMSLLCKVLLAMMCMTRTIEASCGHCDQGMMHGAWCRQAKGLIGTQGLCCAAHSCM